MSADRGRITRTLRALRGHPSFQRTVAYFLASSMAVTILLGVSLYSVSVVTVRRQAIASSEKVLSQLSRSMDLVFDEVDRLQAQLSMDHDLLGLMDRYRDRDVDALLSTSKRLYDSILVSGYIDSIVAYYVGEGIVFSPAFGFLPLSEYWDAPFLRGLERELPRQWTPRTMTVDPVTGRARRVLTVSRRVPQAGTGADLLLVVNLDGQYPQRILHSVNRSDLDRVLIFNASGEPVGTETEKAVAEGLAAPDRSAPAAAGGFVTVSEGRGRMRVLRTSTVSPASGWSYSSIAPYASIVGGIDSIRNAFCAALGAGFLCALALAFHFSRAVLRPAAAIARRISEGGAPSGEEDVYDYIDRRVNSLLREKGDLERELARNMPVLRHSFLDRLLQGRLRDAAAIRAGVGYYGLDIPDRAARFVASFAVDVRKEGRGGQDEDGWNLLRMEASDRLTAAFASLGRAVVDFHDVGEATAIVSLDGEADVGRLRGVLARAQEAVQSVFRVPCAIGVGTVRRGMEEIPASCGESRAALQSCILQGPDAIVFFDERERKLGGRARAYPYAEEDEVVLLLRRGDFPAIGVALRAYASRVGEWCSLGGKPPGQAFLRLYYNVERALHVLGIGMAELTDGRDPFGTMTRLAGLEDSVRFFEGIFEEAGRRIERTRVPYRRAAVAKVIRHVDGHLHEDLSLTKVGEIVFLSPAYLSTVFKEETGTHLSDYIGEARIRRAKEMLCSSRCSIHEVGEAVGYRNAHSFIKFFKAATGMTPGAFRAEHG